MSSSGSTTPINQTLNESMQKIEQWHKIQQTLFMKHRQLCDQLQSFDHSLFYNNFQSVQQLYQQTAFAQQLQLDGLN